MKREINLKKAGGVVMVGIPFALIYVLMIDTVGWFEATATMGLALWSAWCIIKGVFLLMD